MFHTISFNGQCNVTIRPYRRVFIFRNTIPKRLCQMRYDCNDRSPDNHSYIRSTFHTLHLLPPCFLCIGLYRDVWIAAIASSRTGLTTLTGAMCKTSQCELRSLRVNSGMLNVIRIVTYYTLPPLESPTSSWIAMANSR